MYALYKTGQLQTISNQFILVLSISDMCMGLIGQPMIAIMVAIKEIFRNCTLEKFVEYVVFLSANFSWFMLLWISVDRYFQVTKLNRYSDYMNPLRMRAAIGLSILVANALAVVLLLYPSFILQVVLNIANLIMMTVVASLYVYMMRRLKKHDKNLKAGRMVGNRERNLGSNESSNNNEREKCYAKRSYAEAKESRKQLSALKTIRMLIIAIFALYGPYNIASTYWTYYKFGKRTNPALGINIFVMWAYSIVLTNAALNACIIIHGNSKMRRFVKLKLQHASLTNNKVKPICEENTTSNETVLKTAGNHNKEI